MMLTFLILSLLALHCQAASSGSYESLAAIPSGLNSLSSEYGTTIPPGLISVQPDLGLTSAPIGKALLAPASAYPTSVPNEQLVLRHPEPRRILVKVVKPIIFEERIVIVPYRRVTHEVRPVIEERHTVIYGKDGKKLAAAPVAAAPVVDSYGNGASALLKRTAPVQSKQTEGQVQHSRLSSAPLYTEQVVRKVGGQPLTKRSSFHPEMRAPIVLTQGRRQIYSSRLEQRY